MLQVSTLRPGLLVSLKTSVVGNAVYDVRDIEPDHVDESGQRRAKWETQRIIQDPEEHERARKVRDVARSLISRLCAPSSFGMLCPQERQGELDQAIRAACALAAEFNATASLTRVGVYAIAGKVAADDAQAVRAINSEVRDLMTEMEQGLGRLDVQAVRDAANKAKRLGSMLSPYASMRVQQAIDVAREAAKRIVKAGEAAAVEIDTVALEAIRRGRNAFLDLDETQEVAAPVTSAIAVDMAPVDPVLAGSAQPARGIQIDL